MNINNLNNIFESSDCLSIQQMQAYIAGKLSTKEEYLFEKHINSCTVCSDTFEGLQKMQNPDSLPLFVEELNNKIDKHRAFGNKKIFYIKNNFWKIAAAIVLLIGSGFFIAFYSQKLSQDFVVQENLSQEPTLKKTVEQPSDFVEKPIIEERNTRVDHREEKVEQKKEKLQQKTKHLNKTNNDIVLSEDNSTVLDQALGIEEDISIPESDEITETQEAENTYKEIEGSSADDDNNLIMSRTKTFSPVYHKKSNSYLNLAIDAYKDKNYEQSLHYLKIEEKTNKDSEKVFYYFALNYYDTGNYNKSEKYFNLLINDSTNAYYWEAIWYKSQILIKQNKLKKAKHLLKEISNSSSRYKDQALKSIDSLLLNE